VSDEICPAPYSKIYRKMSPTLKSMEVKNDSSVPQIASTANVRIVSNYHAGQSNNARPTTEKLLRFRRSFSSVMDPPVIQ
jgi:hypothetical protein